MPTWVPSKLFQRKNILEHLSSLDGQHQWDGELLFAEHHQSHAASAFFLPFERAAIVTMDGVGEWTTTSIAVGHGNSVEEPSTRSAFPIRWACCTRHSPRTSASVSILVSTR